MTPIIMERPFYSKLSVYQELCISVYSKKIGGDCLILTLKLLKRWNSFV